MTYRGNLPNDQDQAEKAFEMIKYLIQNNDEIDMNCWIGACMSIIADRFAASDLTYEGYKKEMYEATVFYKHYFEED